MLCKTCLDIVRTVVAQLDIETPEDPWFDAETEVSPDDFADAVEQNCYVCCRLASEVPYSSNQWRNNSSTYSASRVQKECHVCRCRDEPHVSMVVSFTARGGPVVSLDVQPVGTVPNSFSSSSSGYPRSTADPAVLSLACDWLQACHSGHSQCGLASKDTTYRPLRLIEIEPKGAPENSWRLVETQKNSPSIDYATLSHRWGTDTWKLLLTENERPKMLDGLPLSALPGVYQDACRVAKRLGLHYLWTDSICVLQDDTLDIQRESVKMAEVYSNAVCNISGLAADSETLFTHDRSSEWISSSAVVLSGETLRYRKPAVLYDTSLWEQQVAQAPLSKRGWIFQEQLLAQRTLYFGKHQMYWECSRGRACETYPDIHDFDTSMSPSERNRQRLIFTDTELDGVRSGLSQAKSELYLPQPIKHYLGMKDSYTVWSNCIIHYTARRELTFQGDRLIAISGITKLFSLAQSDKWLAGIWSGHLPYALLWSTYKRPARANANTMLKQTKLTSEYRAPSWSWASVETPILIRDPYSGDRGTRTVAKFISGTCETSIPNSFAVVTAATLRIRGPSLPVFLFENGATSFFADNNPKSTMSVQYDNLDDAGWFDRLGHGPHFTALFIGTQLEPKFGADAQLQYTGLGIVVVEEEQSQMRPECDGGDTNKLHRRIGTFVSREAVPDPRPSHAPKPQMVPEEWDLFTFKRKPLDNPVEPFDFDAAEKSGYLRTFELV